MECISSNCAAVLLSPSKALPSAPRRRLRSDHKPRQRQPKPRSPFLDGPSRPAARQERNGTPSAPSCSTKQPRKYLVRLLQWEQQKRHLLGWASAALQELPTEPAGFLIEPASGKTGLGKQPYRYCSQTGFGKAFLAHELLHCRSLGCALTKRRSKSAVPLLTCPTWPTSAFRAQFYFPF